MNPDPKDLLYVSDLDGTLLDMHSEFPRHWVERLNRLIDRGLKFTIATARNYDSVHPILHEVNLQLPLILFNGAYLTHFETGENLKHSNYIDRGVVNELLELVAPLEYETIGLMGTNCGLSAPHQGAELNAIANDLGIDSIETGAVLGVAMEAGLAEFGDLDFLRAALEDMTFVGLGGALDLDFQDVFG